MVVLCCIVVVTGFLPFPVSRSSLSSPPSQVKWCETTGHTLFKLVASGSLQSTSFCTQVEHVRIQQLLGQISLLLRGFQQESQQFGPKPKTFCFYLCRMFTKVSWAWWRPEGVNLIDMSNLAWIIFIERFSAYGFWPSFWPLLRDGVISGVATTIPELWPKGTSFCWDEVESKL